MFTLLSEQHKKYLLKQYRVRLLSVIMFLLSALFVSAIAMLLPSYISLAVENSSLERETSNNLKQIAEKNSHGLVLTLQEIKSMVSLAALDDTKIYDAFQTILYRRPNNVSITSVSYERGDGADSTISFEGVAASRASLLAFAETLRSEPMFKTMDLPVSSLAKESDVKYVITVTGKF